MTITPNDLQSHITENLGQTKSQLAQHYAVSVFEVSGPLSELLSAGLIVRKLSRGRAATYHPCGPEVAA